MKDLIKALTIGSKYGDQSSAEHDILYFDGPPYKSKKLEEMEDKTALLAIEGCGFDQSLDSWYLFI